MRQDTLHTPQPSVSAALLAASRAGQGFAPMGGQEIGGREMGARGVRFPAEDGGHSLAEMAERDLDAALQLLADRAQYITGAGGAAIALRRDERKGMRCRASAGQKAPELGALLSTESGLSGESVRTRRPLRCDDAEHDPRVNQESCRDLGIASVMIVPILSDRPASHSRQGANQDRVEDPSTDASGEHQVLGVFELFSEQAGAFAERDLTALQRLGEMVETAVRLAEAAHATPAEVAGNPADEPAFEVEMEEAADEEIQPVATLAPTEAEVAPDVSIVRERPAVEEPAKQAAAKVVPAKWPIMWSAATVQANPEATKPAEEVDQSHVPPMLRSLRKCKACGFPVSEGRTLCVECDEKQWRGQPLPTTAQARPTGPAVDFRQGEAEGRNRLSGGAASKVASAAAAASARAIATLPGASSFTSGSADASWLSSSPASTSPSATASTSVTASASGAGRAGVARIAPQTLTAALAELSEQEMRVEAARCGEAAAPAKAEQASAATSAPAMEAKIPAAGRAAGPTAASALTERAEEVMPNPASLNFTGGLETSESWFSANKYVIAVILAIAATVAAVILLR